MSGRVRSYMYVYEVTIKTYNMQYILTEQEYNTLTRIPMEVANSVGTIIREMLNSRPTAAEREELLREFAEDITGYNNIESLEDSLSRAYCVLTNLEKENELPF